MDLLNLVIAPVVQLLMAPVKKHLGYVVSSTSYVREMSTKMKELDDKGVDVKKREKEHKESNLEIPTHVPRWLVEVEKTKEDASLVSTDGSGCLNVKMRYRVGRKAIKISKEINRLLEENSRTIWNNVQKDLGEVNCNGASTSAPLGGNTQNDFQSRNGIFEEALTFLQPDNKTQVISLCGMGGVGKTTTMKQLKKAVENTNTFDKILNVAVGKQSGPTHVQRAIADYMPHPLTEYTETARADRLRVRFEEMSKGQKKVLVILDDVWEKVDLNNIGLSPLPNGFKVLLTSRFENVCSEMATKNALVFEVVRVDVLKEHEARAFFWKIVGVSKKSDTDLNKIGGEIVKKCGFLPFAIDHIATILKYKEKFVWRTTLNLLKNNDLDETVQKIVKMSYDYLKKEEANILQLCSLFPEDFDIPIEELTRYAWGRKLLKNVSTFGDARDRTRTCVLELQNSNLLIAGDRPGCVKMHDLVLSFVLTVVSEDDYPWIINHAGVPSEMHERCKSISLTCTGISKFPEDFKYPNLSLLKLMHGDESFRFPEDFFKSMEKIEVIAFEKMHYPLLPRSLQCSTNLRTLCLYRCSLMHDISSIGNLSNLEVLSFACCSIRKLPSAIGNLKRRLKLLDLTGSVNLRIDDGVLQNLVELEELYMRVADEKAINFTDANYNELAERSKTLSAMEIEFFKNMALLKNMFWKKLEIFRISMGCYLEGNEGDNVHSFENTLMLCTNTDEILESKINELFEKAEVIRLQVDGMKDLEDVLLKPPQHSLFYHLRVLTVLHCGDLRYLFTPSIATCLSKLERLTISSCPNMKVLIHSDNNETIKFQELKFLSLRELPELVSLCNTTSVIELPKLVELTLDSLPNFSSIYPKNKSTSSMSIDVAAMQPFLNKEGLKQPLEAEVIHIQVHPLQRSFFYDLRVLTVFRCGDLRYLFTPGIATCLLKLERLAISSCHAMEVLIHSDNNETIKFQELKFLSLRELPELVSLCNTASVIELPKLVELSLDSLPNFSSICPENKSTSSMSIDVSAMQPFLNKVVVIPKLEKLKISRMENLKVIWPCRFTCSEEDIVCRLRYISVNRCDNLVNLFPSNPMPWLRHLEELRVERCGSIEVIFDLDLGCVHEIEECSSNNSLRSIVLWDLKELREVWRVKGINNSGHVIRGFQAVRIIKIDKCKSFRNVFTPTTANFDFRALEDIYIDGCDHLGESGKNNELGESSSSINTNTFGEQGITRTSHVLQFIWNIFLVPQQHESVFYNLTHITLRGCNNIKYLLSLLAVKLLSNLKTIMIVNCDIEEVVSNRDDGDGEITTSISTRKNASFLPHFDTLDLVNLSCLKHIGGGNNVITTATVAHDPLQHAHVVAAAWSLCQYSRKIHIFNCNALSSVIPSYAVGQLQKLEKLRVDLCESMLELFESQKINNCGDNSNNIGEGILGTSAPLTIRIPRMKSRPLVELCSLRILSINSCDRLGYIFTFSTLESLRQLEELNIGDCTSMEVIVKEEDGEQTTSKVVVLPRLQSIRLKDLPNLKGFFMGSNEFQWPSLDKVKIIACPQMMVFTSRHSKAPKLNYIRSGFGKHSLECGLNFHLSTTTLQETQSSSSGGSSSFLTSKGIPLSFSNLIEVDVSSISELRNIIPFDELLKVKKLEKIYVELCYEVVEVFGAFKGENSGLNESQSVVKFPELRGMFLRELGKLEYIWRNDRWTILEFPNLTSLIIYKCNLLGHVFTCSMVDSLPKLQQLNIHRCKNMEVIVKEEEEENRGKEVVFPCLKSLQLEHLGKLKGFCLGKEDFLWPSLHALEIKDCPEITVFTNGLSTTPHPRLIDTTFGQFYVEEDINSFVKVKKQKGYKF